MIYIKSITQYPLIYAQCENMYKVGKKMLPSQAQSIVNVLELTIVIKIFT